MHYEFCRVDLRLQHVTLFTSKGMKTTIWKRDGSLGDRNEWDAIARAIAQLGEEGWQLVGGSEASGNAGFMYFQRQVDDE